MRNLPSVFGENCTDDLARTIFQLLCVEMDMGNLKSEYSMLLCVDANGWNDEFVLNLCVGVGCLWTPLQALQKPGHEKLAVDLR